RCRRCTIYKPIYQRREEKRREDKPKSKATTHARRKRRGGGLENQRTRTQGDPHRRGLAASRRVEAMGHRSPSSRPASGRPREPRLPRLLDRNPRREGAQAQLAIDLAQLGQEEGRQCVTAQ